MKPKMFGKMGMAGEGQQHPLCLSDCILVIIRFTSAVALLTTLILCRNVEKRHFQSFCEGYREVGLPLFWEYRD